MQPALDSHISHEINTCTSLYDVNGCVCCTLIQSHSVSVTSTVPMELSEPIDYEDFVKKNQGVLDGFSQKDLVVFPEDDVTVTTLPRRFRTVEIPVPGPAK